MLGGTTLTIYLYYEGTRPATRAEIQQFTKGFYGIKFWTFYNNGFDYKTQINSIRNNPIVCFHFEYGYERPNRKYPYTIKWQYFNPSNELVYLDSINYEAPEKEKRLFMSGDYKWIEVKVGSAQHIKWVPGDYRIVVDIEGQQYEKNFTLVP